MDNFPDRLAFAGITNNLEVIDIQTLIFEFLKQLTT